ncbi:acyl-homoserine-lactone synthase [Shewanella sp. SR44-3]|uniref:acyl-homoserine-lactone synthase n=1 Tax=unclassified Shewanella TaxID=196818 RepID=UPI0015FD3037|nr:acyl-homoserine-lactone synthase [Shewanella sp. SR44-3]MBB1268761.1 GNAT family N-acetyltransferase [Shewanella sp. SR44-3]
MSKITVINKMSSNVNNQILDQIFKLRNETFKQRLGWEVKTENGMEKDNFDKLNVSHIAMTDKSDNVIGCWRALPTQGEYMLKDIFPELLQGEAAPLCEDVWEISRFTVRKGDGEKGAGLVNSSTAALVKSFYDFARENEIKHYVLVTTVACERILRLLGVKTRRMGAGKSLQIGIERSVALWIDIDDSLQMAS